MFENSPNILINQYVKIIVLLLVVTVFVPPHVERRLIILAKTPIVLPADKTNVYSDKYYKKYEKLINQAADEYDVPAPLIAAVIRAESEFDTYAVSRAGAMGLMQLTPETWADLGGRGSPFNAATNIRLGTKYLRDLLDQFRGNLRLTIAAYNAGPGNVVKYKRVPPFKETRRYVPLVLGFYRKYRKMKAAIS